MSEPEPLVIAPHVESLLRGEDLSPEAMRKVMEAVMTGRVSEVRLAAFLVALRAKGESVAEIAAAASVMRAHAIPVQAPPGALDTCGTGGDSSGTFNVSTATALTAAALGIPVAKHGNRSASSRSGSADVLKVLGVRVDAPVPVVERCLREADIGFLFAPLFHPGMKYAAPVRRELGIRTLFNFLGPLANPARAPHQLLGVFEPRWCGVFARVLSSLGSTSALVVCGLGPDGRGWLDEVSTWGPSTLAWLHDGQIEETRLDPRDLGFQPPPPGALCVGSAEESAARVREVLDGRSGPAREIVLLNTAAAAQVAGKAADWREGLALAADALDSGRARNVLARLVECSNRPA